MYRTHLLHDTEYTTLHTEYFGAQHTIVFSYYSTCPLCLLLQFTEASVGCDQ